MLSVARVIPSVIRYRGREGQWGWAVNRLAGLGVLAFLGLHIADIFVVAFGPGLFNDLLFLYKGPAARIGEIFLAFGLIYHALNGLRLIASDFFPRLASLRVQRPLFYIQIILFLALFVPASFFMMLTLPQEGFNNNVPLAAGVTFGILALPALVAVANNLLPAAVNTRLDSDESIGNYRDGATRIRRGMQRRPMDRWEINVWLFMRISGVLLVVLALLHLYIFHISINVEHITFNTIVERWQDPVVGWFWRTYDLALLVFAWTHGILGARYSIEDYAHSLALKRFLYFGAAVTWLALILMGAFVIFFFNGRLA